MEVRDEQIDKMVNSLQTLILSVELLKVDFSEMKDHISRNNEAVVDLKKDVNTIMLWKAETKGFGSGVVKTIGTGWTVLAVVVSTVIALLTYRAIGR